MIFVNSMSDLFHDRIPEEYIKQVCEVMSLADWHTFQVLTKRSTRLAKLLRGPLNKFARMSHIWWGVSVENRKHGLPRIADLQNTPASVKFLSVEPLLEGLGPIDLDNISWVIAGGESGPGARPLDIEWVRSIRDQCATSDVPFFFKQWGGVRKKENGRTLDGRTYDGFPRISRASVPPAAKRKQMAVRYAPEALITISI
jgi:protein gp37